MSVRAVDEFKMQLEEVKPGLEYAKNQGELGATDQKLAHRDLRRPGRDGHSAVKQARVWDVGPVATSECKTVRVGLSSTWC